MKPTLHVLALPHTTLTDRDISCAYSQKIRRFPKMMHAEGYRVIVYGPDIHDVDSDDYVVIATQEDRERWGFGDVFDTAVTPFIWSATAPYWHETNQRAIREVNERKGERDILLTHAGWCQQPVSVATGVLTAEPGVGYEGIFSDFCAFESYAWMHHVYGLREWHNGRYYDAVIPNFFDPDDFPEYGDDKCDYLLFMGRVIERKGFHVAAMIAERAGLPLVVAGPGVAEHGSNHIVSAEGNFRAESKAGIIYVGSVGPRDRYELMARARAVLVPTIYIEPFGGVAVEAMFAGTPAVTSDWGAFSETVEPGITGERFRTLAQGVEAVERAMRISPRLIRKHALERYSLAAVGRRFDGWFTQVAGLWGPGWGA